jgi:hypothetical protein
LPCSVPPVSLPPTTKKNAMANRAIGIFPERRCRSLGRLLGCERTARGGSAEAEVPRAGHFPTSFSPCSLPPNSQLAGRTTHRLFVHRPVETAYFPFDRPTLPARYQKIFKLCQLRSDSTAQAFALLSSRDSRPAASLPPGLPSLAPPPPLHTPGPRQKPPTSAAGAVQCRPAVAASPTRGTRAKQRQG